MELAARLGGLHMSSHARHLSFLQRSMLDAAALAAALLAAAVLLLRWFCAQCTKLRRKEKSC